MDSKTIAIPPGKTIEELLWDRGLSVQWLGHVMNMDTKDIIKLINGAIPIKPWLADKLEKAFDIPAQFWINLEKIYRDDLAKIKAESGECDGIWRQAKVVRPSVDGEYLTYTLDGVTEVCFYSHDLYELSNIDFDYLEELEDRSGFCVWDECAEVYLPKDVDYWTELPRPPDCTKCQYQSECPLIHNGEQYE